jgi:hypothetical protein
MVVTMGFGFGALVSAQVPAFHRSATPFVDAVHRVFDQESANIMKSAELMPADKYDYRPTPAQLSFGLLMSHIAQTNFFLCSMLTSTQSPVAPERLGQIGKLADRATIVPLLKQSFAYCGDALGALSDTSLADEAILFGRSSGQSRASALVTIATDWSDHYSTTAAYLRLNGLLPPSAQPQPSRR